MKHWVKKRGDVPQWASQLGVSEAACRILVDADFIDLHLDLEVPVRLFGYNPLRRHSVKRRPWPFFGHTDFPRLLESGFTGLVYDIATNPVRPPRNRLETTLNNILAVKKRIDDHSDAMVLVRTYSDYVAARADGKLALWISLQGGNALIADPSVLSGWVGECLHRITLVHLTRSGLGGTNSPLGGDGGLTDVGRDFVSLCNERRILVDLAHAGKKTFWDTLEVHDSTLPPIVSHTGVSAVHAHWRNVDDAQIKAIADRGGVIGIMYQSSFLEPTLTFGRRSAIVDHLEHVIAVVGDDYAAIGTDYDGAIIPPADLPDVTHHPVLVQDMLDRGWSEQRIQKILGLNYLRVVQQVCP